MRVTQADCHVAIIGIDNLPARRLTSDTGWALAIDLGLGDRPGTFNSILLRRFPGTRHSDQISAFEQPSLLLGGALSFQDCWPTWVSPGC